MIEVNINDGHEFYESYDQEVSGFINYFKCKKCGLYYYNSLDGKQYYAEQKIFNIKPSSININWLYINLTCKEYRLSQMIK